VKVFLEKARRTVRLQGPPLGRGGEATIVRVPHLPNAAELVAKLYHRPTAQHAVKVQAMIANPPVDPMADQGHVSIAWPLDRVLSAGANGKFLGFVMPRISEAAPIFEIYNPKARLRICPLFHFGYLLRAACNLAAAVEAIHERGYVIGDLNESNVLVNNRALVALVDTDSFQVTADGQVWRCPVGKPEYTAPELQGINFADVDRAPQHDAFALAVLLFQVLMQGIHPFAGRYTGQGEPGTLGSRISNGYWPYRRSPHALYRPNPHAPPWDILPRAVQELFCRSFEDGHVEGYRRPSASEWRSALGEADKGLASCAVNAQHVFPNETAACPWCTLARRQRRDLFPSSAEVEAGLAGVRPTPPPVVRPVPNVPAHPPPVPSAPPYAPLPTFTPVPTVRPARRRAPTFGREEWLSFVQMLLPVLGVVLVIWLLFFSPGQSPQLLPPRSRPAGQTVTMPSRALPSRDKPAGARPGGGQILTIPATGRRGG
jgi:DNA-binding helix-hairpin-helix protein with protein kinase domain